MKKTALLIMLSFLLLVNAAPAKAGKDTVTAWCTLEIDWGAGIKIPGSLNSTVTLDCAPEPAKYNIFDEIKWPNTPTNRTCVLSIEVQGPHGKVKWEGAYKFHKTINPLGKRSAGKMGHFVYDVTKGKIYEK